ncbi:MAG: acetolactate synthase [Clostridiales bacterium]|nr:acetolactate synthase [Clostridiales bacterium]
MTVKQISVFVENKPGQMAEFASVLSKNSIDMRALSIAETKDFGIIRVIVDDSYKTACILKEAGYVFSITPVLAVEIPDEPGGLSRILDTLRENEINVEYTYAFITRKKELAYMIFRVEDNDKAVQVLSKAGIRPISQDELYKM